MNQLSSQKTKFAKNFYAKFFRGLVKPDEFGWLD